VAACRGDPRQDVDRCMCHAALDEADLWLRDASPLTDVCLAESRRPAREEQLAAVSMPHFDGTRASAVICAPPVRIHGASMSGAAYPTSTGGFLEHRVDAT
jgi:hypothetical protein